MATVEIAVGTEGRLLQAVPLGEQAAVRSRSKKADGTAHFELRLATPETLATAGVRQILVDGQGGATELRMVGGADRALLLVRLAATRGWLAYEIDAQGACTPLAG